MACDPGLLRVGRIETEPLAQVHGGGEALNKIKPIDLTHRIQ